MKNFIQSGHTVTAILLAAATSGDGVLIENLFGVASTDGAIGDECELQVTGVFTLPKKSADEPAQFQVAYWDPVNDELTVTATSNYRVGVFMDTLASGTTTAAVRLDGTAIIQEAGA
ncbi:DUF2190 family protein [Pseudohongiella spirulinae]|uniref:Uncharacterized protein n=1 Tax=Pseudohongiella spirulinae TaxID=1249552 RepID=A0A0S2KE40_9GAMM|nr:DUF2190 family protein [Pseudohongiella spirulinae]ALO46577.1 hypothetical protein PS2015_1931 [Pseudohongiella spirulinae]